MATDTRLGMVVVGRLIRLAMEAIAEKWPLPGAPPERIAVYVDAVEKGAVSSGVDPVSMAYRLLQETENMSDSCTEIAIACLFKIMEDHPELNPRQFDEAQVTLKLGGN